MAKNLNEAELGKAAGGSIDYAASIDGMTGGFFLVKGKNAKGQELNSVAFHADGQGLQAARDLCAKAGISADLTKAAVAKAEGL